MVVTVVEFAPRVGFLQIEDKKAPLLGSIGDRYAECRFFEMHGTGGPHPTGCDPNVIRPRLNVR